MQHTSFARACGQVKQRPKQCHQHSWDFQARETIHLKHLSFRDPTCYNLRKYSNKYNSRMSFFEVQREDILTWGSTTGESTTQGSTTQAILKDLLEKVQLHKVLEEVLNDILNNIVKEVLKVSLRRYLSKHGLRKYLMKYSRVYVVKDLRECQKK